MRQLDKPTITSISTTLFFNFQKIDKIIEI